MLNGVILLVISLIGYSAMAGTVGGGGLGDIAIRYGYQSYNTEYLLICSIILIVFVQLIQMLGNWLYKRLS
jgi:D-methionine transport system permease protein